jgi:hypothetical protein
MECEVQLTFKPCPTESQLDKLIELVESYNCTIGGGGDASYYRVVLAGDRVVDVVQVLVRVMLEAGTGQLPSVSIEEAPAPTEEDIEDEQEEGQLT